LSIFVTDNVKELNRLKPAARRLVLYLRGAPKFLRKLNGPFHSINLPVPGALSILLLLSYCELERQSGCIDACPQSIVIVITRDAPAIGISSCCPQRWYTH
jgi:hypothetical protein